MSEILDKIEGLPVLQRVGILVLIMAVIGGGFYQFVYSKNKTKIDVLESQLATLNNELQELRTINKKLPQFKELIAELQGQLDEARQQLPRKKDIPVLLEDISRFGKESGMEFISFRPGKEVPKGFYAEVPVDLVVTGPFHNMARFLDKISHYPRIIQVSNISLGSPVQKEGYLMLRSTSLATTYRYVEQSEKENP